MPLTDEDKLWLSSQLAINRAENKADLADLKAQFHSELVDMETKLLTAFHQWASPMEARMRTHTAALRAVDAEIEYISDRVKALESKPAA